MPKVDFTSARCNQDGAHSPHNWGADGTFYRCDGKGPAPLKYALCGNPEVHGSHYWDDGAERYSCFGIKPAFESLPASADFGQLEEMLPPRFLEVAQRALMAFAEAYVEYGDGAADVMGLPGEWAELHRKVQKLRRPMWQGGDALTRETEVQVLQDLIGHSILAIDMLNRGLKGGRDADD